MKFSRYVKKCLDELEASPEAESDMVLVHLVKLQRLTEQIQNLISQDEDDDIPGMPRAPMSVYQGAFEVEIQRLWQSMPPGLKDNSRIHSGEANPRSLAVMLMYCHAQNFFEYTSPRQPSAFTSLHQWKRLSSGVCPNR